ncbi:FAD-linked oxidase [Luteitalea sp. TBR-22]|uniref:FAD-binding oxidoreductase n=1 Tax=Luteitalea sp. TBR-22 TaxID=2802971 RepID=UPI001AF4A755|nr:FAD-binding oxidoreductase [Luteitalea sp. TBR-22]BCS32176.1 FAD-linked oxidase [Luteitalea sp. TBR-22]
MHRRTFLQSAAAVSGLLPLAARPSFAGLYQAAAVATGDLDAVRGDGRPVTLPASAIKDLAASLRGPVLLASSPGYETARRVLNPSIDRRPALIVQPTGTADVRRAVSFASAHGLLLAVKCGGHSFSGMSTCDKGMQIDLSNMRGVRVDPKARRAYVEGGTLLGLVDHEAAAHGMVTPLGTVSHTGVGGLTTGGGFGRLARKFGLAVDNVVGVDVVTADGSVRRGDPTENPDLYWGVRGGGGNFGIVTNFEFQLHPFSGTVTGGEVVFPIDRARDLLRVYAEWSQKAPDEVYVDFVMSQPPGGKGGIALLHVCYCGDNADRDLAVLRTLGTPMANTIKVQRYVDFQKSGDYTDARTMGEYMKSGFTTGISEKLISGIIDGFEPHPARSTGVFTQHSGGAIGRPPVGTCAFPHRHAQHALMAAVSWKVGDDGAPHMAWAKKYWATIEPLTSGFYINEVNDESRAVLNANYRENFPRMVAVKKQYDPTNLFRLNANVQPA